MPDQTFSVNTVPGSLHEAGKASPGARSGVKGGSDNYQLLRQLGARAYQLRAAARAADHFIAREVAADRETGTWLIACAGGLAEELAYDFDVLARNFRDAVAEPGQILALQKLRAKAHQLHAATRASDYFIDLESSEDRNTGSWLMACALGLADKLAAELEDLASAVRRGPTDAPMSAPTSDATLGRRSTAARSTV